ncbi:MAG: tRNA guanosine(15) transglycosylase TgtA, partial [Candidatus Altarchaeaceae archaeon]
MAQIEFEIKQKDIAGRIGILTINKKKIETPVLMPVYSVHSEILTIDELKNFGVNILMTNAYIIYKDKELREKVLNLGIHKFLNFDGIIAVDSGSYQLMKYGNIDVSNEEILKFESDIKADIGSFLDIPTMPYAYKDNAKKDLEKTLERAKEAKKLEKDINLIINAAIQGSTFTDLRKYSAKFIGKNFKLNAIGGIVPLMENYEFEKLVEIIITVKKNIPTSNVVHAFGLGHPMIFGLAVALGCDIFDSAAYVLFAKDKRYLTENGTKKISELKYLPCECFVCKNKNPEDMTIKDIALHNLYVSMQEIKKIKEAINENCLWDYVLSRAISHPYLYEAVKKLKKYRKFLASFDLITKRSAFYDFGFECRTEIYNVKKRIKNVESKNFLRIPRFGNVPKEILDIYPFTFYSLSDSSIEDIEKIKAIMDYQFGKNAHKILEKFNLKIKYSKESGRMR